MSQKLDKSRLFRQKRSFHSININSKGSNLFSGRSYPEKINGIFIENTTYVDSNMFVEVQKRISPLHHLNQDVKQFFTSKRSPQQLHVVFRLLATSKSFQTPHSFRVRNYFSSTVFNFGRLPNQVVGSSLQGNLVFEDFFQNLSHLYSHMDFFSLKG